MIFIFEPLYVFMILRFALLPCLIIATPLDFADATLMRRFAFRHAC